MQLDDARGGAEPRRRELERVLDTLRAGFPALGDALNHAYMSHALVQRQGPGFRAEES